MQKESLLEKKKPVKAVHKKRLRNVLIVIIILFVIGCVWKVIRKTGSIHCSSVQNSQTAAYSENDAVLNAIALSYLVYGCETCDELSGTVSELLEAHEMGIIKENFGIKRTDSGDSSSAMFDTSDYISRFVGDYRFLCDQKDDKSGFFGAAFCDDNAGCVWIAYAGSVSFRDAVACAEFVLSPRLSWQETQAFELFEEVLRSEEVQNQSYRVMLTGHSLGGSLATMVACASGCSAVAVNGAVGIAVDKYRDMEGDTSQTNLISNYMTSPKNGRFSLMDLVQRLMF
ncbi:MAG: hypothetical protein ACI3W9_01300 [Eubacteriales bacterium]